MIYSRILFIVSATFILMSCSIGVNNQTLDTPRPLSVVPAMNPQPRVALVLGSGGPRGYAHIGILKILEEYDVEVDLVVGSSVGALIGAFWSAGYSAEQISGMAAEGGPLTLFDFSLFLKKGWIKGQRLQDYVNINLNNANIQQLPRSLIVVATNENTGEATFFEQGNVGIAVRASGAVLNIFAPVVINDVHYIDAEESLPVAVAAAHQAGAQFIIAVDVSAREGSAPPGTKDKQLQKDAQRRSRINPQLAMADFVMHPDLDYKAGPWRSYFVAAELEGERYARAVVNQLLDELGSKVYLSGD